jgi:hypothetical protein
VEAEQVPLLDRPVYGMSQAARLLGLRTDGLRRWIDGYERKGKVYAPVIRERSTGAETVTWGEFVEAGYLREYRAKQVSLQYLRPVIGLLRERLGVQYPLATLKPYTSGRELALEVQQIVGLDPELNIVIIGRDGTLRLTDPAAAFVEKVDFAGGDIVERLFPLGRDVPIVLDPARSFGEPTVPGGCALRFWPSWSTPAKIPSGWPRSTHFRCPTCTTPSLTSTAATTNHRPLERRCRQRRNHRAGSSTRTASASPKPSPTSAVMSLGLARQTASCRRARPIPSGSRSSAELGSSY